CVEAAAAVLPDGPRYVGLAPGAGGKRKIWPLANFIGLARHLTERGFTACFFLGPEEAALRDAIDGAVNTPKFPEESDAVRQLDSPLATAALARRMTFSVCNDSGGGHLIAAGGQPTVTLFGHTSARKFASPY